ncbi:Detected protein of unknown function [Hibiscus syriacus]|uniref:Uncharacterized protein n=1 Tax=Hibiscus syriacus TaxID=106335 RepID=A0A6A3BV66_HIBSY|nr:Detected protein of unknown function [Hibiscus syriacus]
MDQTPENLHERNDHVLDIPNDGQLGNNVESRNSQEPVIQQPPTGGSSHGSFISSFCFWIYIRLVFNISQIVASVAVLAVSRNEKPQAPLPTWIVGYAAGCAASIPILFQHCFLPYPTLYFKMVSQCNILLARLEERKLRVLEILPLPPIEVTKPRDCLTFFFYRGLLFLNLRLSRLLEHFKWVLKAYFFVWFVIGNFWLFGGYSSSGASNLHRLCIMFLVFSYLNFIIPFILVAVLAFCCGDLGLIRGAPSECIDSLPTYTFKLQKDGSGSIKKINSEVKGGAVAAGAEKDCAIPWDDAVGSGMQCLAHKNNYFYLMLEEAL